MSQSCQIGSDLWTHCLLIKLYCLLMFWFVKNETDCESVIKLDDLSDFGLKGAVDE